MAHPSGFSAIHVLTPAGNLYLQASPDGLRRCAFCNRPAALPSTDLSSARPDSPLLKAAVDQLGEYFEGACRSFSLALNLQDLPPFQTRVLTACAAIPWGKVLSYAQLAFRIGAPGASRAVGAALANNPLLLFIPCHRVIGSDGALRGFAAPDGIQTKAWLLQHEGLHIETGKVILQTGANP
ncbi:MAG TPA: methylated-DNA--[protein]-cysteine S-methyltransferase [Anaerolineaceae bacterium]|nr:methylated-DNA--[protein]-cysteine S-methyltransferase [Anaerolineaceae bacterium]